MHARKERDQIIAAMAHCSVNVWAVSKDPKTLTMLEGSFVVNGERVHTSTVYGESRDYSSLSLEHVNNREELTQAIDDVMEGKKQAAEIESEIAGRWHKVSSNVTWFSLKFGD